MITFWKVTFNNMRTKNNCNERILAMKDATELLSGKWKFFILQVLSFNGIQRFKDLQENVTGITPKVLSKELQDLEENLLISRNVINSKPISVQYSLTDHARNTQPVLDALIEFGLTHRKKIKLK